MSYVFDVINNFGGLESCLDDDEATQLVQMLSSMNCELEKNA